jgi:uncharacterized protein DUF5947
VNALARLGRFAAKKEAEERCSLCGSVLADGHPHVVDVAAGTLLCSCAGCASLFGHGSGKFRRVPDRVVRLEEFRMADGQWDAFGIPVGIAFFRKRAALGKVLAFYPSPLGPVESSVADGAWDSIVTENPALRTLEDDVEALLVRRTGSQRDTFIAPLDQCYALIGLMRREWKGFTGGDAVRRSLDRFFDDLRARSGGAS